MLSNCKHSRDNKIVLLTCGILKSDNIVMKDNLLNHWHIQYTVIFQDKLDKNHSNSDHKVGMIYSINGINLLERI